MEVVNENGNPIPNNPSNQPESKRVLAGVLAIVLGGFGVHKFVLGYTTEGLILLGTVIASFILTCVFIGALTIWIPGIIGLIEGIIYLTKTDQEFIETYQLNKKAWF